MRTEVSGSRGTGQKPPWYWAKDAASDPGGIGDEGKWANVKWESWTGYRDVKEETRNELSRLASWMGVLFAWRRGRLG